MKKFFAVIVVCTFLSACSSSPSESNLKNGLKTWLGINHAFSTTFNDSTKMKVVECNKIDHKTFDSMNIYLRFSTSDQAGMKNLGYLCGVSFQDDTAIPVFAVQSKKNSEWLAQPVFAPDYEVRNEIKKIFNVTN